MTAPRTSPLTEEEARGVVSDIIARYLLARVEAGGAGVLHDVEALAGPLEAALLRVDSEAYERGGQDARAAGHGRKSPALLRMTEKRDDLRVDLVDVRADLDEAVRLLDEDREANGGGCSCVKAMPPYPAYRCWNCRRDALLARHPTPSTPTTTTEET